MNTIEHAKKVLEEQEKRELGRATITINCEKCGYETTETLIGDEFISYCPDCNWVTN